MQNIVVKKNTAESVDFSTSPFRPLADFFKELVDRSTPHSSNTILRAGPGLVRVRGPGFMGRESG